MFYCCNDSLPGCQEARQDLMTLSAEKNQFHKNHSQADRGFATILWLHHGIFIDFDCKESTYSMVLQNIMTSQLLYAPSMQPQSCLVFSGNSWNLS